MCKLLCSHPPFFILFCQLTLVFAWAPSCVSFCDCIVITLTTTWLSRWGQSLFLCVPAAWRIRQRRASCRDALATTGRGKESLWIITTVLLSQWCTVWGHKQRLCMRSQLTKKNELCLSVFWVFAGLLCGFSWRLVFVVKHLEAIQTMRQCYRNLDIFLFINVLIVAVIPILGNDTML